VGELPGQIRDEVERFTADGAHDKTAVHDLPTERGQTLSFHPGRMPGYHDTDRLAYVHET